ncbi:MAG: PorV/PorQ family protein [Bacteroidia bacterium]|nr:PorV/PorQ family protein [Bacteroidia bacterium]
MVCTCLALSGFSQSTPKYSNEFLFVGVGGKAFGMSQAVVAGVDDVTAGYWNPAGLVHLDNKIEVSYMHSNYFAGIANYDYGGLAFSAGDNSVMAVSFVRMGVDGIPNTLDVRKNGQFDYDLITEFSAVDYSFLFSYAQKLLKKGLSVGGNAKIIRRKAGQFASAWGFGVDAALQWKRDNGWNFALVARDVTSTFNAWNFTFTDAQKDVLTQQNQELPKNSLEITLPRLILGASKKWNLGEKYSLLSEINADLTTDGKRNTLLRTNAVSIDPHMGIQLGYSDAVFLRGGIGNIQKVSDIDDKELWSVQPNVGVGIELDKFALDYAMANVASTAATNYSHVFSIRFKINSNENKDQRSNSPSNEQQPQE